MTKQYGSQKVGLNKNFKVYHITFYHQLAMGEPTIGGIRSFIQDLHDNLLKARIQSRIIPFALIQKECIFKAFRVPIVGIYPYLLTASFLTAFTFVMKRAEEKFLIHAHDVLFGGLVGVLIKFVLRRPLIVTTHGVSSSTEAYNYISGRGNTLLSRLNRFFLLSLERFVVRYADKIMCTSEYEYKYFSGRSSNVLKISVVRNGIDVEKFKSKRPIFSKKYVTILYAGRISPEKGVRGLIRVFALLEEYYQNLKLLIVGEGDAEKAIVKKMIERLQKSENIVLLPPVNRDVIEDLYNDADIVMFPSTMETGTPLTLLEAMACERVVVVNSSGSLPPIVNNAGLTVPFNNPTRAAELIKRILHDKKEAVRLTSLARQRVVKNFNWQNCFEEILDTYASMHQNSD